MFPLFGHVFQKGMVIGLLFFLTLLNKACTVIATYDVIFVLSFIIIRQNVKFIYTYTFVMSNV